MVKEEKQDAREQGLHVVVLKLTRPLANFLFLLLHLCMQIVNKINASWHDEHLQLCPDYALTFFNDFFR